MMIAKILTSFVLTLVLLGCGVSPEHQNSRSHTTGNDVSHEKFVNSELSMPVSEQEQAIESAIKRSQSEQDFALTLPQSQISQLDSKKQKMTSLATKRAVLLSKKAARGRGNARVLGYIGVGGALITNQGICGIRQLYEIRPFFQVILIEKETVVEGECADAPYFGAGVAGIGYALKDGRYGLGVAGIAASTHGACLGGFAFLDPNFATSFGGCSAW